MLCQQISTSIPILKKLFKNPASDTPNTWDTQTPIKVGYKAAIDVASGDKIYFDFGSSQTFTAIYLKMSSVSSVGVAEWNGSRWFDISTIATETSITSTFNTSSPALHEFYEIVSGKAVKTEETARYIRLSNFTTATGHIDVVILLGELILGFQDGAFSEINYTPQYPTRGHHRMLKGGMKPYAGLGVKNRKMTLGSNHVPHAYDKIGYTFGSTFPRYRGTQAPGYIDLFPGANWSANTSYSLGDVVFHDPNGVNSYKNVYSCITPNSDTTFTIANWSKIDIESSYIAKRTAAESEHRRYYNPAGTHDIFADASLTDINKAFDDHLEFVFADSLDVHPDRIFPASFEGNELSQPFSNKLKSAGHDISFTVVEI